MVPTERGVKLIHNPVFNKGTAFTELERQTLGLKGLLPPKVLSQELQATRIMENLRKKPDDLEKYIYMVALQDRNENLFYYVVEQNLEELLPIIYTPTVGRACQSYGHIYRRSRGLYISIEDKNHVKEILLNWPHKDVKVIVVTDGGRILGLGDLGVSGMGIPIGKLALYTACAGIDPTHCLPITIDVGTNNETLLKDPLYLGRQHHRITGNEYDSFFQEFIESVQDVFPNAIIQFEDFATANAFNLLKTYRNQARVFNDDIQGTAAVALAGILASLRITKQNLKDQKILFLGAGEAGIGIGDMISFAMQRTGLPENEAKRRIWFMDSKGLVCASRNDLASHKTDYAHDHPFIQNFNEAVRTIKPNAIIGVSGQGGQFSREVIESMSEINDIPIIFALSNPTSKSECTAEEAYSYSHGKAVFASGSPFQPVELNGKNHTPGQGNNVYIFPGLGLGVSHSNSSIVTGQMFYRAACVLAEMVTEDELSHGTVYPSFNRIKEVSTRIAIEVVETAIEEGLCNSSIRKDLKDNINKSMYKPDYPNYI